MKGGIYEARTKGIVYYQVKFGNVSKTFKHRKDAERFLTGIRYETDQDKFDERDYKREKPLSFSVLAAKWLAVKKQTVKPRSWNNLNNYMNQAMESFGDMNVKVINFGHLEDFLFSRECSDKTRANMRSCLHTFFDWVHKREHIPVPDFPECPFELGYRKLMDLETQYQVLDTLSEIAPYKVWLGCKILSTYLNVRPGELRSIKESDIHLSQGFIVVPDTKEGPPKMIGLDSDDIALFERVPRGLPDLPFFRHDGGVQGSNLGQPYGPKLFNEWWKRACQIVGIEGVPLYPGTRHSTVTALGKTLTPEQLKAGTGHATNKAFERYYQSGTRERAVVVKAVKDVEKKLRRVFEGAEKSKVLNFKD